MNLIPIRCALLGALAASCTNFTATCIEKGTCERNEGTSGGAAGGSANDSHAATGTGGTGAACTSDCGTGSTAGQAAGGGLDCATTPCGYIEGKVTLAGQPSHAGVTISFDPGGFETGSDDAGDYRIDNIPVGSGTVHFSAPGFSPEQLPIDISWRKSGLLKRESLAPWPDLELVRGTRFANRRMTYASVSADRAFAAFGIPERFEQAPAFVVDLATGLAATVEEDPLGPKMLFSAEGDTLFIANGGRLKEVPLIGGEGVLLDDRNVSNEDGQLFLSPEADWLVYAIGDTGLFTRGTWTLQRISDGTIVDIPCSGEFRFSPDGAYAIIHDDTRGFLFDVNSGALSQIADHQNNELSVVFSTSGERLLIEDARGISIADLSLTEPESHVVLPVKDGAWTWAHPMAFTEDEKGVIYFVSEEGALSLKLAAADADNSVTIGAPAGSGGRLRPELEAWEYPVFVTNTHIFYSADDNDENTGEGTLFSYNVATRESAVVAENVINRAYRLSPNGAHLIYAVDQTEGDPTLGTLYSTRSDLSSSFSLGADAVHETVTFSPEGNRAVFLRRQAGSSTLETASLLTGKRHALASAVAWQRSDELVGQLDTPKGPRISFIADREDSSSVRSTGTLFTARWDGASRVEIATGVPELPTSSPDGEKLLYIREGVLTIRAYWGGPATALASDVTQPFDWLTPAQVYWSCPVKPDSLVRLIEHGGIAVERAC